MNLQTIIEESSNLPSSPQLLPRLQTVLRDEDSQIDDITSVVKMDASLAAQVLKVANSAFYGSAVPAESLDDAVNRLGFQEMYRLVGTAVAKQALGGELEAYGMAPGELWETSIIAAITMEHAAKAMKLNAEAAYTVGLLHGIGKLVINQYYMQNGIEIYDSGMDELDPKMERQLLGFDHAEAGAALLQKWDFASDIYAPIQVQLSPLATTPRQRMACMIHLASWTATRLGKVEDVEEVELDLKFPVLKELGYTRETYRFLLQDVMDRLSEIKESIKV